jgi:hypothetical protein
MSEFSKENQSITFSPGLYAGDNYASYWLHQVTTRLRREICWCWHERGIMTDRNFIDNLSTVLPPFADKANVALNLSRYWDEKKKFFKTDNTAAFLTDQLKLSQPEKNKNPVRGSFEWIVNNLNLDDTSSFVLALGLIVHFDNAVGSIISSCLNDSVKTYPNLALAQKIWDYPEKILKLADSSHPLFGFGLLQYQDNSKNNYSEINWEGLIWIPSIVANQLLFPNSFLPSVLHIISKESDFIISDIANLIAARLKSESSDTLRIVPVRGEKNSDHIGVVSGIAKLANRQVVEFKGDPRLLDDDRYLNSIATFCWLRGMDLYIGKDLVSFITGKQNSGKHLFPLQSIPITIFFGITEKNQLENIPNNILLPIVDVPKLSYEQRIAHWKKNLGEKAEGLDNVIMESSRRFRYERESIDDICEGLKNMPYISEKDFVDACRAELEVDLGDLAQRVTPRFDDEKLILPPEQDLQFQEIVTAMKSLTTVLYDWKMSKAWNENGISVLFAGPSGTGKTMAAEILAIELGLPMYRIDLSQVVNKYVGETEKNLKRLFDAADVSDVILFFDEADSLFGHRTEAKDAHDRFANMEINYLLERMERFKGLAILATNRKKDLDEAFLRRLRYILDFALPPETQRKKIWYQTMPKSIDTSSIDFDFLAKQFSLTGGHIRSIVLNACLQSAKSTSSRDDRKERLTMEEIIIAVKREYGKLNRSVSYEQFGKYAEIIKKMENLNE